MSELILAPLAVRLHWRLDSPAGAEIWRENVTGLMGRISQMLMDEGASLIGHVKAMTSDGGARVSSIAAGRPPQVSGSFPDNQSELSLDLVVLVYGLETDGIERAIGRALEPGVTMEAPYEP